eukprot:8865661-Pyramimonas_sp.AAC.1
MFHLPTGAVVHCRGPIEKNRVSPEATGRSSTMCRSLARARSAWVVSAFNIAGSSGSRKGKGTGC